MFFLLQNVEFVFLNFQKIQKHTLLRFPVFKEQYSAFCANGPCTWYCVYDDPFSVQSHQS